MAVTPEQEARPAWERISAGRRWAMLGSSTAAQAASAAMVTGPAFLIPELHTGHGMSLAEAGLVASAPLVGMMLTLVAWGLVVDHKGERFALLAGLVGAAAGGLLAIAAAGSGDGSRGSVAAMALALVLAGGASGATNSASGRVVVGWFPPERRGLAMGIRQTAQPLGVGLAAATMAVLADRVGIAAALWVPTGACLAATALVAVVVLEPPRPERRDHPSAANPYRADGFLARIHGASVLLVGPQFLVWTFGLTWMVDDLGWSPAAAGLVMLGTQVGGAGARIAAGWWSDVAGSRMRPMRQVAVIATLTMLALGAASAAAGTAAWLTGLAVVLLVAASAVTVADNGLAFTAVAERAGPFWSGRAMGVQNTAQHLMAAVVPPVAGLTITGLGYGPAFALAAALPLLAVPLVPVRHERLIS
ncbi:MFS transporter [Nocardioides sp. YIM 152588]|uniref:MFS transporter n=1 Tax=Nocardioides sp. YIM 152588 TaxID=3158259 RepID=UPI0032E40901